MYIKEAGKKTGEGILETGGQPLIYFATKLANHYLFLKRLGSKLLKEFLKEFLKLLTRE